MDHLQKNDKTERARGLGRNTEDRKRESNDSPEIPDRERLSDIPVLPSWGKQSKYTVKLNGLEPSALFYILTGN